MGLFTNKKKLCPICGNPTPRFLSQKFEDQPICKECEDKIDLPGEILDNMTLQGFREYLVAYGENAPLRSVFHATYDYGGALFVKEQIMLDEENDLIRLKNTKESWAIEKQCLKSFRILEDEKVLFESGEGILKSYPSEIPAQVEALEPLVSAFCLEKREYERREELERIRRRNETDEERMERERINRTYAPSFTDPQLLKEFRVEIRLSHPYWTFYEEKTSAPMFDSNFPSIESYLREYQGKVDELHILAIKLMYMIDPNAQEKQMGANPASADNFSAAAPVDAVAEIKKYKELLEQGIITEEEFAAKKRQLLGI